MGFVVGMFLIVGFLALALMLGPACVNYILLHVFHHTVAWGWALLICLITGDATIPLAVIVKILVVTHILN